MFKRLLAAYRRVAQLAHRANLDVVPLETRVTPALTPEGLALPPSPAPVVQIAYTHEPYVRTDLFGAGVVPETPSADDVWCQAVPEHDDAVALLPIPYEQAAPDDAALPTDAEGDAVAQPEFTVEADGR